jgi:hypothetical protein
MSISLGLKMHGELAEEAIRAEFDQLFNKKKALKPVKKSSLSKTQLKKILRSSMFLKEKRDGRGVFEKLKGRVVPGQGVQDLGDRIDPAITRVGLIQEDEGCEG